MCAVQVTQATQPQPEAQRGDENWLLQRLSEEQCVCSLAEPKPCDGKYVGNERRKVIVREGFDLPHLHGHKASPGAGIAGSPHFTEVSLVSNVTK